MPYPITLRKLGLIAELTGINHLTSVILTLFCPFSLPVLLIFLTE